MEPEDCSMKSLDLPMISDDIDMVLDMKAEKTNLSVTNVKNILKNVIMNENVIEMVCSSLQGKQIDLPYEPKLTRSKTRELRIKKQPLSTVCALPLTDLTPKPSTSECHVLIDKEFSDDSSDEEYMPSDEFQSDDDFDDTGSCSTVNSTCASASTLKNKRRRILKKKKKLSILKNNNEKTSNEGNDKTGEISGVYPCVAVNENNVKDSKFDIEGPAREDYVNETIGHRTRSKLSLSETPLETIEQQFIPPDITCDMYDWNCDNEDWKNFLKEFTQPLDALPDLNETADDVDADPEYNVLADEEEADEDKEELRVDRAVKVSRKELNDLMKELFEYGEMMSNIEKEKTDRERAKRKFKKPPAEKPEEDVKEQNQHNSKTDDMNSKFNLNQKLLLQQQLRQHVQLTTQHFLQTFHHPVLDYLSHPLKSYLFELRGLGFHNKNSFFNIANLESAIEIVEKWERITCSDSGQSIIRFMEKEVEKSDKCLEHQVLRVCKFPPIMMQLISESDAFPYPLLLPPFPFYSYNLPEEFVLSEELLLILGYSQFLPYVKDNKKMFRVPSAMNYAAELISKHMMPVHSPMKILKQTKSRRTKKVMNPLKEYFSTHKVPSIIHYIIPISEKTLVKDHPEQLLPHVWSDFLK